MTVSILSRRRPIPWLAGASALCLAAAVAAQQVPTRIVVEGRPVPLTATPVFREGRLFVPLLPIAQELRDEVEVDPTRQAVQARLSHTGETRTFLRATGEVRRDGAVLAVFPDAAQVDIALRPETQFLPLEVVAFLLDVSAQVNADEGIVYIRRQTQIQIAPQVQGRAPINLNRWDYSETLGFVGDQYGHTFRMGGRSQLYDGSLTGAFELTGGSNRSAFNFLRGFMTLERPSGQRWTGGDFTLAQPYRLASAPARGFSLEQPLGNYQLSLFGGGALSSATVGAGQFSLREFHTGVFGLLWSNQTLLRGQSGWGYGFGGLHFAGADRRGSLFLDQLSYRTRTNQFQLDAGVGQFRAGFEGDAETGPDFGIDVSDAFTLRQHTFLFRASHFGTNFLTPQINDALRGRDLVSGSWSAPVLSNLTLGASYSHTDVDFKGRQSSNTYTWSAAYSNPRRLLPEVSVFHVLVRGTGSEIDNFLLNLSRTLGRWRPFLAYNRLEQEFGVVHSGTFGTSTDLLRYGSLQVYQNVSTNDQLSGTVDWYPLPLWSGRLQLSGGLGYVRNRSGPEDELLTNLTSRVAVWARLPAEHTVQFSFQHSGFRREFRVTVGGAIFSRPAEVSMTPALRRTTAFPSRLSGRLYQDNDLNGRFDPAGDSPLAKVRLWLDNSILAVTDEEGRYRYEGVGPGAHGLRVDFATVRADLTPLNELDRILEIPARVDFTVDFSFVQTGLVTGMVWYDLNRNGARDPGESPAGNIRVVCSCGTDAVTTVDGGFILSDLLPGEIYLSVDLQGIPPAFQVTPTRIQVRVLSGRQVNGVRFALRPAERPVEEQVQPPQQLVRRGGE